MSKGKLRGITVEIGGDTTKLGKALESVNSKTRDLQSELKGVESLLKMDPGNTDLLAQRQQILTEAVEETTEKLKILKEAEEQVAKQFENGDIGADQFRDFQREIISTENKLDGFKSKLNGTEDEIEDVGNAAEESGDGFTIMGGALADLVSSAIQGAISVIGDLVGALFELSEATEEYRTMQAKLEGSANTFGYSADFAKSKYEEFYKYLGDDQAATNAITNLMGVGTSTESLTGLVDGATAAWATYGDSINVESLTEAISETVTCGKVTGSFADTINWCKDANEGLGKALSGNKEAQKAYNDALEEGLPVEDAFNEALAKITDEQERADVVAKFLNDTYGESKKTYDETAGSILDANEAELQLKDTQAQLGETMQPVNTALTDMKNQALSAITPLVEALANGFMDLYNWMNKNPTAMKIVTAVVIALATAFGVLATALAIQGLITGVTKAIAFLNTTLLANPIVLIVAAIAGLVAAFIYLWNNCESFRQFWINLWEGIKSAFSVVVEWIKVAAGHIADFFVAAWNKIKEIWNGVTSFFSAIWDGIKAVFSVVSAVLGAYFSSAWEVIKLVWSVVVSYFKTIWENIKLVFSVVKTVLVGFFQNAWNGIKVVWNAVTGYFKAIWDTIKGIFSVVKNVLTGNWKAAWDGIKGIVNTWKNYFSGVWNGIKSIFSGVGSWFKNIFNSAWSAIKGVFSNWGSFFGGLWNKIKNTFSNIGTKISSAISGSVKSGINGVISSIERTINRGIGLINGAIGLINQIPGVSVGTLSNLSLPRLAKGGIVDDPTIAEIGENGREAIIPLENNTGWLRELARELNDYLSPGLNTDNGALLAKLDGIYERLGRLQIVLDNGTLIGESIDLIDAGLADKQLLSARGV